jgi:hypothetical protein
VSLAVELSPDPPALPPTVADTPPWPPLLEESALCGRWLWAAGGKRWEISVCLIAEEAEEVAPSNPNEVVGGVSASGRSGGGGGAPYNGHTPK